MTTKADPLAVVERARSVLKAEHPPVAELESRALDLKRLIAAGERDVEELDAQRKSALVSEASAGEVAKTRAAIRGRSGELTDLIEFASTVLAALEARLSAAREEESATKRRADYEAVLNRHSAFVRRAEEFLGRFGPEGADLLREYVECSLAIDATNLDLPLDARPIPTIEASRRGERQQPKVTTRKFMAFVEDATRSFGRTAMFEQGKVQARRRGDGKWDVFEPGNAATGGSIIVCELVEATYTRTETPSPRPYKRLGEELSIPRFDANQNPWFRAGPVTPGDIERALDSLKTPPPPMRPRVEERTTWIRLSAAALHRTGGIGSM